MPIFETSTKGIRAQDLSIESGILTLSYHARITTTHALKQYFLQWAGIKYYFFSLTFALIVIGLL